MLGIFGTDIASSQERSIAVSVSLISLCIWAATARFAADSSRFLRCNADRTSRSNRSIPVSAVKCVESARSLHDRERDRGVFDHLDEIRLMMNSGFRHLSDSTHTYYSART
jgi:hypothetical protein